MSDDQGPPVFTSAAHVIELGGVSVGDVHLVAHEHYEVVAMEDHILHLANAQQDLYLTVTQLRAHPRADLDKECTGQGKCHGCLKWCANCGDVAHTCDTRLRGVCCAEHPVPPSASIIRTARHAAEKMIADGKRLVREGEKALEEVVDVENAHRTYYNQVDALLIEKIDARAIAQSAVLKTRDCEDEA